MPNAVCVVAPMMCVSALLFWFEKQRLKTPGSAKRTEEWLILKDTRPGPQIKAQGRLSFKTLIDMAVCSIAWYFV